MLVIQISLFDLPILKKHRGDCWRCFNSLFHGQDETRLLCNVEPCLKINWRNSKKIELLERAFRCFERAFFEVLHVAGKITRVTLPTSCISCSCRSCDSVWCLRDSWRGVSPSLSWTSNLALSRTRSYCKQKASYKLNPHKKVSYELSEYQIWNSKDWPINEISNSLTRRWSNNQQKTFASKMRREKLQKRSMKNFQQVIGDWGKMQLYWSLYRKIHKFVHDTATWRS